MRYPGEQQAATQAIKAYKLAIKMYVIEGSIVDILNSMMSELDKYSVPPDVCSTPSDWMQLAGTLSDDLNLLVQTGRDNGIDEANILAPLSEAAQYATSISKRNDSEPEDDVYESFAAIQLCLEDTLNNLMPSKADC